ncbi:hypothetical protein ACFE04_026609 [Oxalis oulophora]
MPCYVRRPGLPRAHYLLVGQPSLPRCRDCRAFVNQIEPPLRMSFENANLQAKANMWKIAQEELKKGSGQGERKFKAEVEIISRVHHRHLVSLVGYCISEDHRLLVYAFVSNDTLDHHLHGHPRIIHRDIKSSNILLDDHFEAQVADFGLAKSALDTNTHLSTRVMGTFGYMAPEYAQSGKLTDKSDVYSFGVVLLELITGRKPVDDTQPLGDESLVEWSDPEHPYWLENKHSRFFKISLTGLTTAYGGS